MIEFFIIFTIIGFTIGSLIRNKEKALGIIFLIAVVWAIGYSFFWGLVSFAELILGYFISQYINDK
ncbi:MAG: hypothetical protein DRG78_23855 [Epsilonproteobacteria bacterium]|nr:MAG: hypothetical protein DRG78_23855 [Campylobacterota bacterium]